MVRIVQQLIFGGLVGSVMAIAIYAEEPKKTGATTKQANSKSTSKSSSSSGGLKKPKEEFGQAEKAGQNYENAGKAAAKGAKSLGTKTADGNIAGGAADFGKGMGKMGKEVGVGTAKVGTSVGRGVGSVFSGGGSGKSKKTAAKPKKKES